MRSGSDSPVLSARDLVKEYGSGASIVRALDGVSLDVEAGAFVSIMGPSGSGKSTLLHVLGGLDAPTSGDVTVEGRRLAGLSDRELTLLRRLRLGFVFQFFNLVPVLSVAENVALPAVIAGERPDAYRDALDGALEMLGIGDLRDRLPSEISGGQQQRVAIARALLRAPAVLLADEPTGNLDSRSGQEIIKLLKGAQTKLGQTVVVVTHDATVASYADVVVHLRDGSVEDTLDVVLAARNGRRSRKRIGGEERAQAVRTWLQELGA